MIKPEVKRYYFFIDEVWKPEIKDRNTHIWVEIYGFQNETFCCE